MQFVAWHSCNNLTDIFFEIVPKTSITKNPSEFIEYVAIKFKFR